MSEMSTWSTPECPFTIEYSPGTLEDIRMAVVDAFFSVPRGGVEIGGILSGTWDGERLTITDYAALDCEHAFGPSFTLSPRDETQLAALLAASQERGVRPVGWYHSHTRSEIFLSDADREIHRRFFPEPWQVALVLKPHTFQPTRAGFFFRGAGGEIHAEASYNEIVLAPRKVKPAPLPSAAASPVAALAPGDLTSVEPEPPPPLPSFLDVPQPRSRRWPKVAIALLTGFVLGAAAYLNRDLWWAPVLAMTRRQAPVPAQPPSLGLNTFDTGGQLQIRWNRNSTAVQQAAGGVLTIDAGGPSPQEIPLDQAHLLSGAFTFVRQTERVDVSLDVTEVDGRVSREVTTFMGKWPAQKAIEDPQIEEQRDNLSKEMTRMRTDLDAEIARNTKLKKTVDQLTKQLHDQQRSRLLNQAPGKK